MSPHAYTEDQLVEKSAIGLLAAPRWLALSVPEEIDFGGAILGQTRFDSRRHERAVGTRS